MDDILLESEAEMIVEEEPNYLLIVLLINAGIISIGSLVIYTLLDKRKNGSNLWFKRLYKKAISLIPKKKQSPDDAVAE